jgi:hypothetical protein
MRSKQSLLEFVWLKSVGVLYGLKLGIVRWLLAFCLLGLGCFVLLLFIAFLFGLFDTTIPQLYRHSSLPFSSPHPHHPKRFSAPHMVSKVYPSWVQPNNKSTRKQRRSKQALIWLIVVPLLLSCEGGCSSSLLRSQSPSCKVLRVWRRVGLGGGLRMWEKFLHCCCKLYAHLVS